MSYLPLLGQDCTAGSRVYVQDSVYDKFIELLIEKVKSTPIGDGFDDTVANGPLVSERATGARPAIYGGLTQNNYRSQKPISIGYGVTLIPEDKKEPEPWSAEKDARVVAIS